MQKSLIYTSLATYYRLRPLWNQMFLEMLSGSFFCSKKKLIFITNTTAVYSNITEPEKETQNLMELLK